MINFWFNLTEKSQLLANSNGAKHQQENFFAFYLIFHYFIWNSLKKKTKRLNSILKIQEKTVYLDLVDTSGVVDLSISHWLIDNNFAYSTKKKVSVNLRKFDIMNYLHKYLDNFITVIHFNPHSFNICLFKNGIVFIGDSCWISQSATTTRCTHREYAQIKRNLRVFFYLKLLTICFLLFVCF